MLRKTWTQLSLQNRVWLGFLAMASVTFTLAFACAAPLAAFAAMSALTLKWRSAAIFTGIVWLINQAVGFAFLSYPLTANSLSWGAVIGIAAIAATLAAHWSAAPFEKFPKTALPLAAFLMAFAVYELTLYAAAATYLGATEDFTPAIIGEIFETNAIAMVVFVLLRSSARLTEAQGDKTPAAIG